MVVGAIIGVASASFLRSKEGKVFVKDASKRAAHLQKMVLSELRKTGDMTEQRYNKLVDTVVAYYAASKGIAKHEIPTLKKQLLSTWKTVRKELKAVKKS